MATSIKMSRETVDKVVEAIRYLPPTSAGQTKVDNIVIDWGADGIVLSETDPIMDSGVGVTHKDRKEEREKEAKGE
jgi:hypothetical protein